VQRLGEIPWSGTIQPAFSASFRSNSLFGQAIIEEHLSGASQSSIVILIEDNSIYTESDAVLQILARLSPPWSWIALLRILPRRIRDACYRFVVRHRYQWFGRTEVCQIPSTDIRSRFVE
jgi:predicted DCC family thiol-disulfide oxidoreductase YuxK